LKERLTARDISKLSQALEKGYPNPLSAAVAGKEAVLGELEARTAAGEPLLPAVEAFLSRRHARFCRQLRPLAALGETARALDLLGGNMRRVSENETRLQRLLAYPLFSIILSLLLFALAETFLLPRLAGLGGVDEPGFPGLSIFVVLWIGLPLLSICSFAGLEFLVRKPAISHQESEATRLDRFLLSLPLLGKARADRLIGSSFFVIGRLLEAGTALPVALERGTAIVNSPVLRRGFRGLSEALSVGFSLDYALSVNSDLPAGTRELFPPALPGPLARRFTGADEALRARETERFERLRVLVEPASTLYVGALVAVIAASVVEAMLSSYRLF
jgi:type II secretory pathway component PulF